MSHNIPDWARDVAARLGAPKKAARTSSDTSLLREIVLEHVGRRPVPAAELFERVRDDFGSCGTRRLWRALAWQVARGAIIRIGAFRQPEGYVRAPRPHVALSILGRSIGSMNEQGAGRAA